MGFFSKNKKQVMNVESKLNFLEEKITELEEAIFRKNREIKSLLLKINHKEQIQDSVITESLGYNDMSPEQAFRLYSKTDFNFIFIDVSKEEFHLNNEYKIEEAQHFPLEFLEMKAEQLQSFNTPIFVISEQGVRSILACESLFRMGFNNIIHISGGHKFWPGHRIQELKLVA